MQKVDWEIDMAEKIRIKNEKKLNAIKFTILIAIALLLIGFLFMLNWSHKKRVQRYNESLKYAKQELKEATNELNLFTRKIHENNNIIEILYRQLGHNDNNALVQLQQSTILTDEEWETFRSLFDKVHIGYLQRLKEKFPLLTPSETRFLALSKLNLSNKEMAATLGIGLDAIRQTRSRLRKKLDLTDDEIIALMESI